MILLFIGLLPFLLFNVPPAYSVPDPDMSSDFLAYTGWEKYSPPVNFGYGIISNWNPWDNLNSAPWSETEYGNTGGGHAEVQTYASQGISSPPNGGTNVLKMIGEGGANAYLLNCQDLSGQFYTDIYESRWLYFPSAFVNYMGSSWTSWGGYDERNPVNTAWSPNIEGTGEYWFPFYFEITDGGWLLRGGGATVGTAAYQFKYFFTDSAAIPYSLSAGRGTGYVSYADNVIAQPQGLPADRWFRIEYYVHKTVTQTGVFKWWVTDPNNPDPSKRATRLVFNIEGIETATTDSVRSTMYKWSQLRNAPVIYYADEEYLYNYNAHDVPPPPPPPEPEPPHAGEIQVSNNTQGALANITGLVSSDATLKLSHWKLETNNTGTAVNITGSFGAIIFTFDDNDQSLSDIALGYMNSYGYDGVAFVITTKANATAIAQALSDADWEIGSHTKTHPHLGTLSGPALSDEVVGSKTWLEANIAGCAPVISFAYPYGEGSDDSEVLSYVTPNYLLARHAWMETVWDGSSNYAIKPYEIYNSNYAENIQSAIAMAKTTAQYVVLLTHDVKTFPTAYGITPTNFNTVLNQIQSNGLSVVTFKEAYNIIRSGASGSWKTTLTLNSTASAVHLRAWVNDTDGVWSEVSERTLILSASPGTSDPPWINSLALNTTTISMPAILTASAIDDVGLSGFIVSSNNSGSWVNETWTAWAGAPTAGNFNHTYTLNGIIGKIVDFRVYVNDTDNQWATATLRRTTTDYTSPTILSLSHSTTVWHSIITFSTVIQDDYGLEGLIFSTNNTETWVNSTYQNPAGTPTYWSWNSASLGYEVDSVAGARVEYKIYTNNTKGKWSLSQNVFFVSHEVIRQLTAYVYPSTPLANVLINGTWLTDANGHYEWPSLTNFNNHLTIAPPAGNYYPAWIVNATSYTWETTYYSVDILEYQTGLIIVYFYPAIIGAGRPYIETCTTPLMIRSVTSNYDEISRKITLTITGIGIFTVNPEAKFTLDVYKVTGADDWFWNGLTNILQVVISNYADDSTIEVYWH